MTGQVIWLPGWLGGGSAQRGPFLPFGSLPSYFRSMADGLCGLGGDRCDPESPKPLVKTAARIAARTTPITEAAIAYLPPILAALMVSLSGPRGSSGLAASRLPTDGRRRALCQA